MELAAWIAFAGASLVLSLAPGPDNIFVLMQSVIYGRSAGLKIISGLCSGLLIHTLLVTLGVAALISASPVAFTVLKGAGCLYLVYLAVLAWRAPVSELNTDSTERASGEVSFYKWWSRGFIMNLTNPKVVIFFLAFFPQFITQGHSEALQMILMGCTFIAATVIVFGLIACCAELIRRQIATPRVQQLINRTGAVIFVLLAVNLIFT